MQKQSIGVGLALMVIALGGACGGTTVDTRDPEPTTSTSAVPVAGPEDGAETVTVVTTSAPVAVTTTISVTATTVTTTTTTSGQVPSSDSSTSVPPPTTTPQMSTTTWEVITVEPSDGPPQIETVEPNA